MEWIDLRDKLPELGKWVLGLTNYEQGNYEKMGGGIYQLRRTGEKAQSGYERTDWMIPAYVKDDAVFTHWTPLPNFPKDPFDKNLYLKKFFMFPENNNVPWGQDFCCFRDNAPSGIKFELTAFISNERVTLRAYGYGMISGDRNSYGNGALCLEIKDIIPYMVEE